MITLTLDKQQLTLARPPAVPGQAGATRIVVSHDAPALARAIGQLAPWPAATVATPAQLGQRLARARARYLRESR
jgi:hypothetical protein